MTEKTVQANRLPQRHSARDDYDRRYKEEEIVEGRDSRQQEGRNGERQDRISTIEEIEKIEVEEELTR